MGHKTRQPLSCKRQPTNLEIHKMAATGTTSNRRNIIAIAGHHTARHDTVTAWHGTGCCLRRVIAAKKNWPKTRRAAPHTCKRALGSKHPSDTNDTSCSRSSCDEVHPHKNWSSHPPMPTPPSGGGLPETEPEPEVAAANTSAIVSGPRPPAPAAPHGRSPPLLLPPGAPKAAASAPPRPSSRLTLSSAFKESYLVRFGFHFLFGVVLVWF